MTWDGLAIPVQRQFRHEAGSGGAGVKNGSRVWHFRQNHWIKRQIWEMPLSLNAGLPHILIIGLTGHYTQMGQPISKARS
jgi:hypothetical protein